jgi:hypothetical protein
MKKSKRKPRRLPPWAIIVPDGTTLTIRVDGCVLVRERAILVQMGGTLILEPVPPITKGAT